MILPRDQPLPFVIQRAHPHLDDSGLAGRPVTQGEEQRRAPFGHGHRVAGEAGERLPCRGGQADAAPALGRAFFEDLHAAVRETGRPLLAPPIHP